MHVNTNYGYQIQEAKEQRQLQSIGIVEGWKMLHRKSGTNQLAQNCPFLRVKNISFFLLDNFKGTSPQLLICILDLDFGIQGSLLKGQGHPCGVSKVLLSLPSQLSSWLPKCPFSKVKDISCGVFKANPPPLSQVSTCYQGVPS